MTVVNIKKKACTHYIGRPSPLGNPFVIGRDGDRASVIAKFEAYARLHLMDEIAKLPEDAVLGCWCAPEACHGDAIIKLWKELHG